MPAARCQSAHPADAVAARRAELALALGLSRLGSPTLVLEWPRIFGTCRQVAASFIIQKRTQRAHPIHVAAQSRVVIELKRELDGRDQSGSGHVPEPILRHPADVHHECDAAPGPDINWCAAAGDAS